MIDVCERYEIPGAVACVFVPQESAKSCPLLSLHGKLDGRDGYSPCAPDTGLSVGYEWTWVERPDPGLIAAPVLPL